MEHSPELSLNPPELPFLPRGNRSGSVAIPSDRVHRRYRCRAHPRGFELATIAFERCVSSNPLVWSLGG